MLRITSSLAASLATSASLFAAAVVLAVAPVAGQDLGRTFSARPMNWLNPTQPAGAGAWVKAEATARRFVSGPTTVAQTTFDLDDTTQDWGHLPSGLHYDAVGKVRFHVTRLQTGAATPATFGMAFVDIGNSVGRSFSFITSHRVLTRMFSTPGSDYISYDGYLHLTNIQGTYSPVELAGDRTVTNRVQAILAWNLSASNVGFNLNALAQMSSSSYFWASNRIFGVGETKEMVGSWPTARLEGWVQMLPYAPYGGAQLSIGASQKKITDRVYGHFSRIIEENISWDRKAPISQRMM